jgi:malonyl-CoA O-methyltransferase
MITKEILKNNFSKSAPTYDRHCSVQDACGLRLIDGIKRGDFHDVLDVGCGTGNYTRLLKDRFPDARITALDISSKMVAIARKKITSERVAFAVADAEELTLDGRFDLISSNACFQWFTDLRKAFLCYRGLLRDNGFIAFSTFGPKTFYELKEALRAMRPAAAIAATDFAGRGEIETVLNDVFGQAVVTEEIIREEAESLRELLRKIRYTGARGARILEAGFWTPGGIARLEDIYRRKFGRIVATYQVFFCRAYRLSS